MRGKQDQCLYGEKRIGITPAGAGKTEDEVKRCRFDKDHPRRCGENALFCVMIYKTLGITPADAGKTKATLNERFVNQDHPRGCGENA